MKLDSWLIISAIFHDQLIFLNTLCLEKTDIAFHEFIKKNYGDLYSYSTISKVITLNVGDELVLRCPESVLNRSNSLKWFYTNNESEMYQILTNQTCDKPNHSKKSLCLTSLSLKLEGYYICTNFHMMPFGGHIFLLRVETNPKLTLIYRITFLDTKYNLTMHHRMHELIKNILMNAMTYESINTFNFKSGDKKYEFISQVMITTFSRNITTYFFMEWDPTFYIEVYDLFIGSGDIVLQIECDSFNLSTFFTFTCFEILISDNISSVSFQPIKNIIKVGDIEMSGNIDKLSIWHVRNLKIIGDHKIYGGVWILSEDDDYNELFTALDDISSNTLSPYIQFYVTLTKSTCSEIVSKQIDHSVTVPLLGNVFIGVHLTIIIESNPSQCGNVDMLLFSRHQNLSILYDYCRDTIFVYIGRERRVFSLSRGISESATLELVLYSSGENMFLRCNNIHVSVIRMKAIRGESMMFNYRISFLENSTQFLIVMIEDMQFSRAKLIENNRITVHLINSLRKSQNYGKVSSARYSNSKKVQSLQKIVIPKSFDEDTKFVSMIEKFLAFETKANVLLKQYNAELQIVDIMKVCAPLQEIIETNDNWRCLSCLPGHYFNKTSRHCEPCQSNHYQFKIRAEECIYCNEKGFHGKLGMDSSSSCALLAKLTSITDFYDWLSDIGLANFTLNGTRVTETGFDWKPSVISIMLMFSIVILVVSLFAQSAYYTTVKVFMRYVDL